MPPALGRTAWSGLILCMAALLLCTAPRGFAAPGDAPQPRIAVQQGRFVAGDAPFEPRGFNYIRLNPDWHSTFAPAGYDAEQAETALAEMQQRGFNTVRVFIDFKAGDGIVTDRQAADLSPAYLANFFDFVERAARHRIYVIAAMLDLPESAAYRPTPLPEGIGPQNAHYLDPRYVAAKQRVLTQFVQAVRAHDPALLPAIMAYELDNETCLYAVQPPFSLPQGSIVNARGEPVTWTNDDGLQQLADDAIVHWADQCVAAIRAVDPAALVSVNVFTFAAVHRSGPGRLHSDTTPDPRFPARPLALARTTLDYLDIHIYLTGGKTLEEDLASIEFDAVAQACRAAGKPVIMGEFGSFKQFQPALSDAAVAMARQLRDVYAQGFAGFLYWTWDCDEQSRLWNARSGAGEILNALTPIHRAAD